MRPDDLQPWFNEDDDGIHRWRQNDQLPLKNTTSTRNSDDEGRPVSAFDFWRRHPKWAAALMVSTIGLWAYSGAAPKIGKEIREAVRYSGPGEWLAEMARSDARRQFLQKNPQLATPKSIMLSGSWQSSLSTTGSHIDQSTSWQTQKMQLSLLLSPVPENDPTWVITISADDRSALQKWADIEYQAWEQKSQKWEKHLGMYQFTTEKSGYGPGLTPCRHQVWGQSAGCFNRGRLDVMVLVPDQENRLFLENVQIGLNGQGQWQLDLTPQQLQLVKQWTAINPETDKILSLPHVIKQQRGMG